MGGNPCVAELSLWSHLPDAVINVCTETPATLCGGYLTFLACEPQVKYLEEWLISLLVHKIDNAA
jgi:hypothetical protein